MQSEPGNISSVPSRAASRRTVLKMLGAAATLPAVGGLAGCGGGSSGGGNSLTLVFLGDATQQKAFQKLFQAFNDKYPKIDMEATGIAADGWAKFAGTVATRIAGGKVYDTAQIATEGQLLFASKGILNPLKDYIAKDSDYVKEFYKATPDELRKWTQKYGSTDENVYYMYSGYNTMVAYCKKEVFKKAGVELPDKSWTWDQFKEAGKQIKKKTGAFLLPVGYSFLFGDIMPWLLTNGTSTLNDDWDTPTLDSTAAIEAATFVRSLVDEGLSPKPGGEFDAAAQMKKNKLAMLGGGRWPTLEVQQLKMVDDVRILEWPHNATKGTPVGWGGWPIFEASENKDSAWKYLKWLMSPDAAKYYAKIGGTNVPARTAVAQSDLFLNNAPEGTEILSESIKYGTPIPSPKNIVKVQEVVTQAWQQAVTGTKPVKAALTDANEQLKKLV